MTPTPSADGLGRPQLVLAGLLAVVILAAGLVTVAVRRSDSTTTTTSPPPAAAPPSTDVAQEPSTTTTTTPPPSEPAYITEIKAQVSELRGLAWKAPLVVEVVPRDELTRRAQAANDRDRRPDRMAGDEDTLKVLDLIPDDMNLIQTIDDLFTAAILGFYDPKTKELVVGDSGADGSGSVDGTTKVTVAHELDHALTDQWFELGPETLALEEADREEEDSAYVALIEGDAKFLEARYAETYLTEEEQLSYVLGALGGGDTDSAAPPELPAYLEEALYFPYDAGLAFVEAQAGAGANPFVGIDAAWQRPPVSTEQILHPETYAANQGWSPPGLVDLAAATGCESRRRNTLGEFTMRELLESQLDPATAEAAAAGWNGDTFETVRCGSTLGLVDRWEADTEADASQLAEALSEWAQGWSGSAGPGGDGRFSGPGGAGRITQDGTRVDLVVADDRATADRLASAA